MTDQGASKAEGGAALCPAHHHPWVAPDAPDGRRRCTFYVPELGASEDYGCPQDSGGELLWRIFGEAPTDAPWDGPYDWNAETEEWVCQPHGIADCRQSPTCEHYGRLTAARGIQ